MPPFASGPVVDHSDTTVVCVNTVLIKVDIGTRRAEATLTLGAQADIWGLEDVRYVGVGIVRIGQVGITGAAYPEEPAQSL
jgi:hypothetical protein